MRGSCLCGTIEYEVTRLDSPIRHCSCPTCRKAQGTAFSTSARVEMVHFAWVRGSEWLKSFESSPGKRRFFCGLCGSPLIARHEDSNRLMLRVASLDDDPGQVPQSHIWQSLRPPWLVDGPDLKIYPEWDPGHEE
ncbi:GFA family protein [Paludibacterium paludis]|uniref:Aldehyde-activating protein n=1 Tax=Paludibacterium paludis TaxID=1225769 RepID=A0A918P5L2_9NEIS|nr:GFA family protein [Paludibacterium paludis]GGY22218.1 aldehyde-activating protein [Paludibacterium paludis]